jgi:hypothetical protein
LSSVRHGRKDATAPHSEESRTKKEKTLQLSNNDVHILVFGENLEPRNVTNWKIEFPPVSGSNYAKGKNDPDRMQPWVHAQEGNKITIRYHVGLHKTEPVAIEYLSKGHGAAVTGSKWPEAEDAVIALNDETRSAGISVHGNFEAPHELNFYFEVTITTQDGLVMNLLLAQTSSGKGWLHTFSNVEKATTAGVKAGFAAYEGNAYGVLKQTLKFTKTARTIFKESHNPWLLTVRGTTRWPAVSVEERAVSKERSVLFVGPAGPESTRKIQTGRFFHDPDHPPAHDHSFTFQLQLYDVKEMPPEEKEVPAGAPAAGTLVFLTEDDFKIGVQTRRLSRCDADGARNLITAELFFDPPRYRGSPQQGIVAHGDLCCYFSLSYSRDGDDNHHLMVYRVGSGNKWAGPFPDVRERPLIDGTDVYFTRDDGIYKFESDGSASPARILHRALGPPRRLTLHRASVDDEPCIYYLSPRRGAYPSEQRYELRRCDVRGQNDRMIVDETDKNGYGLCDIQFVICKDRIYFVGGYDPSLYRSTLVGGAIERIGGDEHHVRGGPDDCIFPSPDEQFIFLKSVHNPIYRISSHDDEIKWIWPDGKIQAVSAARTFVQTPGRDRTTRAVDFDGHDLGLMRVAETGKDIEWVLEFDGQLYGSTEDHGGRPMVVRGEIPINPKEHIRFMGLGPGRQIEAVSAVT